MINNINEDQIKSCLNWLEKWVTPIATINKKFGSYKLKHVVEESEFGENCHKYVSEESFIEATSRMGYKCKDGYFNMSFKKILVDPKQYQAFYGGSLKPSNKSGRIKWDKMKGWKKS